MSKVRMLCIGGLAIAALAGAQHSSASPAKQRCLGAAARDAMKPCHNRHLRYAVRPRPSIAVLTPNEPCERLRAGGTISPCAFGVPADEAEATVALIGDSHASHWRAALQVVALERRWHGISITNGICPVSAALRVLPPEPLRVCADWNQSVVRWLANHPEVSIVVHAQLISRKDVFATLGQSQFDAKVSGYRRVWHAFPPTVRHIVAVRDNPKTRVSTPGCVMRARAHHRRPGLACSVPRRWALRSDPLATAARASELSRVGLVNLTHFFCGTRRCYPVVGGVLVHKDEHHISRAYSRSLGPYLLRRLDGLIADD
jgi:SGNH domain-containing protein